LHGAVASRLRGTLRAPLGATTRYGYELVGTSACRIAPSTPLT
jgi:hypothetical protein